MKNKPIIRTQGNVIQLLRYKVTYKVKRIGDEKETDISICTATMEEAEIEKEMYGGTITPIDTTGQEWLDGINVGDTNMPFDRALEIAAMGELGYKAYLENEKKKDPDALLKENEALKQQVTDLEMAMTELYENMGV